MKNLKKLFEQYLVEKEQKFTTIAKNIKAEIDVFGDFKSINDELDKKYVKVLKDALTTVNKYKKIHKKEDLMTWDDFKKAISDSKSFKEYNKDKITDVSDFKHMMNY